MLAAIVILAIVVIFQAGVIATSSSRSQKRIDTVTAQERARQDLLLNRLSTRTPGEFVALTASLAEAEAIQHSPPAPAGRHLYDVTGLIHDEVFDTDEFADL